MQNSKPRIEVSAKGTAGEFTMAQADRVRVTFGPHHFAEIFHEDGRVKFVVGATHHGFMVDASEVPSQLERLIEEVRAAHPDLQVD